MKLYIHIEYREYDGTGHYYIKDFQKPIEVQSMPKTKPQVFDLLPMFKFSNTTYVGIELYNSIEEIGVSNPIQKKEWGERKVF